MSNAANYIGSTLSSLGDRLGSVMLQRNAEERQRQREDELYARRRSDQLADEGRRRSEQLADEARREAAAIADGLIQKGLLLPANRNDPVAIQAAYEKLAAQMGSEQAARAELLRSQTDAAALTVLDAKRRKAAEERTIKERPKAIARWESNEAEARQLNDQLNRINAEIDAANEVVSQQIATGLANETEEQRNAIDAMSEELRRADIAAKNPPQPRSLYRMEAKKQLLGQLVQQQMMTRYAEKSRTQQMLKDRINRLYSENDYLQKTYDFVGTPMAPVLDEPMPKDKAPAGEKKSPPPPPAAPVVAATPPPSGQQPGVADKMASAISDVFNWAARPTGRPAPGYVKPVTPAAVNPFTNSPSAQTPVPQASPITPIVEDASPFVLNPDGSVVDPISSSPIMPYVDNNSPFILNPDGTPMAVDTALSREEADRLDKARSNAIDAVVDPFIAKPTDYVGVPFEQTPVGAKQKSARESTRQAVAEAVDPVYVPQGAASPDRSVELNALLSSALDPGYVGVPFEQTPAGKAKQADATKVRDTISSILDPGYVGTPYGQTPAAANEAKRKEAIRVLLESTSDPKYVGTPYSATPAGTDEAKRKEALRILLESISDPGYRR